MTTDCGKNGAITSSRVIFVDMLDMGQYFSECLLLHAV